jgi:microcystin-dependent protein
MTAEIDGSGGVMRIGTGLVLGNVAQSLADSSRLDVIDMTDAKLRLLGGSNRFNVGTKNSGESYLMNVGSQDLEFGTNNTYRMTIKNTGNIGIGTRTPSSSYTLDVCGNTNITGNANIIGNTTISGTLQTSSFLTTALSMSGTLNMSSNRITNLPTPVASHEAANMGYVTSYVTTFVNNAIPVGGIIMWSGSTIPTNWRICDGNSGTPNLSGRFILGSGSGTGLTSRTLGSTGGLEKVTLAVTELPAHGHTGSTPAGGGAHFHYTDFYAGYGGDRYEQNYFQPLAEYHGNRRITTVGRENDGAHTHTFTTSDTGSSQSHENMPPFYVLAYIMRFT